MRDRRRHQPQKRLVPVGLRADDFGADAPREALERVAGRVAGRAARGQVRPDLGRNGLLGRLHDVRSGDAAAALAPAAAKWLNDYSDSQYMVLGGGAEDYDTDDETLDDMRAAARAAAAS